MIHAENIKVDTDEGRYVLVVTTEPDYTSFTIDIHEIALDFYATVQKQIGPYAAEADSARKAVNAGVTLDDYIGRWKEDTLDAYALDDPKHPTYHERFSAAVDVARKAHKEAGF